MRNAGLALAALLLFSQSVRTPSEDRSRAFLIGTYLGDEMRPDADSALHRTYYVRTEDGTWALVSYTDPADSLVHNIGLAQMHFRSDRPNLLDSLKHGEKFAFRVEPDHRIGATKNSFHVYIPRADDPKREDKFDADFTPIPVPNAAPSPTDNVKAMCQAHRFTPDQEKQYCGNQ